MVVKRTIETADITRSFFTVEEQPFGIELFLKKLKAYPDTRQSLIQILVMPFQWLVKIISLSPIKTRMKLRYVSF